MSEKILPSNLSGNLSGDLSGDLSRKLPLQDLFYDLRSSGLMLGVEEYELLLQALLRGFGIPEEEPLKSLISLKNLCKNLWAKSLAEREVFDRCFDRYIYHLRWEVAEEVAEESDGVGDRALNSTQDFLPSPTTGEQSAPSQTPEASAVTPDLNPSSSESKSESSPEPRLESAGTSALGITPVGDGGNDSGHDGGLSLPDRTQVQKTTHFLLSTDYLPISKRQMAQSWRYLRRPVRGGAHPDAELELDLGATINQIAQQRVFLEPVLVPRRVNRSQLVLLLDLDGSMVAFHGLEERLRETTIRGRSSIYYFHNCPVEYLYQDRAQTIYFTFEQILQKLSPVYTSVLIFSDAGAARGGYNEDRVELTKEFLQPFQKKLRSLVWLNPVPQGRWSGTTAAEIAKLIPMFEMFDRDDRPTGFPQAIKALNSARQLK